MFCTLYFILYIPFALCILIYALYSMFLSFISNLAFSLIDHITFILFYASSYNPTMFLIICNSFYAFHLIHIICNQIYYMNYCTSGSIHYVLYHTFQILCKKFMLKNIQEKNIIWGTNWDILCKWKITMKVTNNLAGLNWGPP